MFEIILVVLWDNVNFNVWKQSIYRDFQSWVSPLLWHPVYSLWLCLGGNNNINDTKAWKKDYLTNKWYWLYHFCGGRKNETSTKAVYMYCNIFCIQGNWKKHHVWLVHYSTWSNDFFPHGFSLTSLKRFLWKLQL